jgi:hypothetical protein
MKNLTKPYDKEHPSAGQSFVLELKSKGLQQIKDGAVFLVEDWAIRVWEGVSWMEMAGNPTALIYAARSAPQLPLDDRVLYGKIDGLAALVHVTELGPRLV